MKSLQDYRNLFRSIASQLNLTGDSVELLIQLLSQATYINEVENISYLLEASLEKSTLLNSKIQHCMNNMYSVYRGACPRVIMKFKANKYFSFQTFQEIVTSNSFKIYYLGYYNSSDDNGVIFNADGTMTVATLEGFNYSPVSILPGDEVIIVGLLAKSVVDQTWKITKDTYYVECRRNGLSNDMYVQLDENEAEVTRDMSEHILNNKVFDLTITSLGSRLYIPNPETTTSVLARYFVHSKLSEYNDNELRKIAIRGTSFSKFDSDWLTLRGIDEDSEIGPGILLIPETSRDFISNIHYKASKERYATSIIRSNSDIGLVLEETYPSKVRSGGTSYKFTSGESNNLLTIYYIPEYENNALTNKEISDFIENKKAYYITDSIKVLKGRRKNTTMSLDVELYQNLSIDDEVKDILSNYSFKFGVNLDENSPGNCIEEIKTLIGKISNVSKINKIQFSDASVENSDISYYEISPVINSKIVSKI